MIERILQINNGLDGGFFLSGPRQAGKTTAMLMQFPNAIYFDLLDTDIKNRYMRRPAILYELLQDKPDQTQVIIDEIAEVPELLKEVTGLLSDAIISLFSVVRAQEN